MARGGRNCPGVKSKHCPIFKSRGRNYAPLVVSAGGIVSHISGRNKGSGQIKASKGCIWPPGHSLKITVLEGECSKGSNSGLDVHHWNRVVS